MTNELSLHDLDQASGGFTSAQKLAIAHEAAVLQLEVHEHKIRPAQAKQELQGFEFRLMVQSVVHFIP